MTPTFHLNWDSDLPDLLDRQRGLCAELQLLAAEQRQVVGEAAPDAGRLRNISSRRRNAADQLARLVLRLEPYRRDWMTAWPEIDAPARARVQGLLGDLDALLDALLQSDKAGACA